MKITFHGAAHEVTGSCHLIETKTKKILFDCGMFQGSDYNEGKNHDNFPFDPRTIDAVFLSHAHADHSGRIPKLFRDGFRGTIYGTKGTVELAALIWADSYQIMKYNNRKFQAPISFEPEDIALAKESCQGVDYNDVINIGDGVTVVFKDAGHIFGSAFIELSADGKKIAFSGDLGNNNVPILQESAALGDVDALLIESTYGDRIHEPEDVRKQILLDLVKEGCERGGVIMMPAFSLERTQEIIYTLEELFEHDKTLPHIPIYIDSPLAIRAVPVYKKYKEYYDEAAMHHHNRQSTDSFLDFKSLTFTPSVDESKAINEVPAPKMIIAGSGMMTGGRILHHAKRYLSDPKSMLVIVGYQAYGTLGRRLYEGAETVKIHGEEIPVRCKITAIGALSAHGDQEKLFQWATSDAALPKKIYCVHGEAHAATKLAHRFTKEAGIPAFVPELGETVEI